MRDERAGFTCPAPLAPASFQLMLVIPNEAPSSMRSVADFSPAAVARKASVDIRTVTPEPKRVTCTVPHAQRLTRTAAFDTRSVWGPHFPDDDDDMVLPRGAR